MCTAHLNFKKPILNNNFLKHNFWIWLTKNNFGLKNNFGIVEIPLNEKNCKFLQKFL